MPGVSVLPAQSALSPTFGRSFHAPMQNGSLRSPTHEQTVAEIKEKALHDTYTAARGASAISLIKTARALVIQAQDSENDGDLKAALSKYYRAVGLVKMFMDNPELKAEHAKGVLTMEFKEFQQYGGGRLQERTKDVENRLVEMEKAAGLPRKVNGGVDGPVQESGGSIADRMRSLQNAGMTVDTTSKRISRELPKAPTTLPSIPTSLPSSPRPNRVGPQHLSIQTTTTPQPPSTHSSSPLPPSFNVSSPSPGQPAGLMSPVISASTPFTTAGTQAFVPASTLGPPSPTSSTTSSPRTSHFNLDTFQQQFPSIDELDELQGLHIPPAATGGTGSTGSSTHSNPRIDDVIVPNGITPKAFPVLPTDTGTRISSTSGLSNIETYSISRPSSPARMSPTSRASPSVPRKPSALSLNSSPVPGRSPRLTGSSNSPQLQKPELPQTNTTTPRQLYEYMYHPGIQVLLLDLRTRAEFEREHIKGEPVVCLEPMVLRRDNLTGDMIEDSLSIAPQNERIPFSNRDKFDLVVMYDDASADFGPFNSPFMSLGRAIYENAFRKMLKKIPVLLEGGLQAWKAEFGEGEVVKGDGTMADGVGSGSMKAPGALHSASSSGIGIVNGTSSISAYGREEAQQPPSHSRSPAQSDPQSVILGRGRAQTDATTRTPPTPKHQYRPSVDQQPLAGPSRTAMDDANGVLSATRGLSRRPALSRPPSGTFSPKPISAEYSSPSIIPTLPPGNSGIQYPAFARPMSPTISGSSTSFASSSREHFGLVSPPPQASINPSPLSRRRSDFVDQSQEALSSMPRQQIDYPDLSSHHVLRPPPAVAASTLERQDVRPARVMQPPPVASLPTGPRAPTIQSDYPVHYWGDSQISPAGLKNMGNTCYMNSTIQCLNATVPFARFFLDGYWQHAINMVNPLGTKGAVTAGFATLLRDINQGAVSYLTPVKFRADFIRHANQFDGSEQHDCQEFLSTLLDSLHEDMNRILQKPTYQPTPERERELERLPQQIASEQEWHIYRMRNDSLIVDFFQGQFRNRLQCLTCQNTSTTYNTFMYLTLPVPTGRLSKVTLQQCLDAFVKEEIMEKSDAWNCPHCKALRRATKQLSLSRLPPILLIHLKRFSSKGAAADKIETFVDFPTKGLDLTNYMPPPLPPGVDNGIPGAQQLSLDDPRRQIPPYKYDLYAVTNHFGSLSSGHYTAFISSRNQWLYCDDSRVVQADPKEVVGKPAYVLFYKRVKA